MRKVTNGKSNVLSREKLRGGYYTPEDIANWIANWAIRSKNDSVLEPSCGNGQILAAAGRRLISLKASRNEVRNNLMGVEFDSIEATASRKRLKEFLGENYNTCVFTGDFFEWCTSNPRKFDVIIGNPPFIRYQNFPEPHRSRAMRLMKENGLSPNRLTNIWVPFVVAATDALGEGGRLGFVLPAELLQVSYAAQLREYLTSHFLSIEIVACNELMFQNAEQEVLLVLASGRCKLPTATSRVSVCETNSRNEITSSFPEALLKRAEHKTVAHDSEKWLKYFLSAKEISFMRELRASPTICPLSKHASVDVGVVTGNNGFFVLTREQVSTRNIPHHTVRLVSKSAQLKGARISSKDWIELSNSGDRVYLLDLESVHEAEIDPHLREYIRLGEVNEVHLGFKCSIRNSWFAVPSVWSPDGFLLRQIHEFPKLVHNEAGATSTDTIHRVTYHSQPETVVSNTYTWLFAASAEIEGRSYGGGVLELEPTEAERLLMPSIPNGAMPLVEADKLIRGGKLADVLAFNSKAVLREHLGLSQREAFILRDIWTKMRERRMSRRKERMAK